MWRYAAVSGSLYKPGMDFNLTAMYGQSIKATLHSHVQWNQLWSFEKLLHRC